jgi:hypothetical protein
VFDRYTPSRNVSVLLVAKEADEEPEGGLLVFSEGIF